MVVVVRGEHTETSALAAIGKAKKTRVLFLDTTRFYGPLMQVHGRVIRHLDPGQCEVYLLADSKSGSLEFLQDTPHLTIWLHPVASPGDEDQGKWRRFGRLLANAHILAGLPKAAWKVRRQQIVLLHVGLTVRMLAVGIFLSAASGARLVLHVHERPSPRYSRLKRLLFRIAMARASAVIAVSGFIKDQLVDAGVKEGKVTSVLNTVDLDRFHPNIDGERIRSEYGIARDDVLVVCLGRFLPSKGQMCLAKAMAIVRAEAANAKALLIGPDDFRPASGGHGHRAEILQYCQEHGLSTTVIVDTARPDAPEVMAAADIVAIPSTNDPCPLTALEAMASGKPIVAFRSGGVPEEVGAGDEGALLVAPGDVEALARAILSLAKDPDRRRDLGYRTRQRAERLFYEGHLAEEVMKVYEQVVQETSPAQP